MNNDLHSYIHNAFQRHFESDLINVKLDFLPHEAHASVKMKQLRPEMKTLADAIENEFHEMDRQVTINVIQV